MEAVGKCQMKGEEEEDVLPEADKTNESRGSDYMYCNFIDIR